jgi:hypothetical protein
MQWSFNYIAITNKVEHALLLDSCGIQQIMVDTERIGKAERQLGSNAVINFHQIEDVAKLKSIELKAKIICRINGYHAKIFKEIEQSIDAGADILMLPMIQNLNDFSKLVNQISNRVEILPLIETPYSIFNLNKIIEIATPSQLHFGLNDLHLSLGMKNLFEVLLSPLFASAVSYANDRVNLVGIGGVGYPISTQKVAPQLLINEHLLLGSRSVILSRSFFSDGYNRDRILFALNLFEHSIAQRPDKIKHNELINQVERF